MLAQLSQDELAALSGVGQTVISRLEKDKNQDPGIGSVLRVTRALNMPEDVVIQLAGELWPIGPSAATDDRPHAIGEVIMLPAASDETGPHSRETVLKASELEAQETMSRRLAETVHQIADVLDGLLASRRDVPTLRLKIEALRSRFSLDPDGGA